MSVLGSEWRALLVAIGTLVVVAWGENEYDIAVATTMAFMTVSMLHIVGAFEWRDPTRTVFTRSSIANGRFNLLMLTAFAMAFLAPRPSARSASRHRSAERRPMAGVPDRHPGVLRAR